MQGVEQYLPSWPVAAVIIAGYLLISYLRSSTYQLRHIPTVGNSGLLSSYFAANRFFYEARNIIQEGYEKYYGAAFKVATMGRYMVVVSGPEMVDDIRRASDDQLSFRDAVEETVQIDYMLGKESRLDPYHVDVVRTPLTRNLGYRFDEVKDEIVESFNDLVPVTEEWSKIAAYSAVVKIVTRTSNRLFVGLPLCRNPEYREINETFALQVISGAQTINRFPKILRPIVGRYMTKVPSTMRQLLTHLGPIIEERLQQEKVHGPDWEDPANDLITWLLAEAKGHQRTVEQVALRILGVNFAAIHTTSMAFTNALYDLAAYPEYVEPLREEIEAVIASEGWTKVAMGKMRKLDSFLKESQRMSSGVLQITRKALQDFTFSNGIKVPAGSILSVASHATHHDEEKYIGAGTFNGYRFSEKREVEGESIKHRMVALGHDILTFGTGKHACPGRFFAVNELKALVAHMLLTYDIKFADNTGRPPNLWHEISSLPNPFASVLFRKRADTC